MSSINEILNIMGYLNFYYKRIDNKILSMSGFYKRKAETIKYFFKKRQKFNLSFTIDHLEKSTSGTLLYPITIEEGENIFRFHQIKDMSYILDIIPQNATVTEYRPEESYPEPYDEEKFKEYEKLFSRFYFERINKYKSTKSAFSVAKLESNFGKDFYFQLGPNSIMVLYKKYGVKHIFNKDYFSNMNLSECQKKLNQIIRKEENRKAKKDEYRTI